MIKDLTSISLLDILPSNLLEDPQVSAAARALDAELQAVTRATAETLHLPRLDELPETVVDLLAWQWHVDFYEPLGLDIATKRRLVKESIAWHRTKGTPAAVEKMLKAVWGSAHIEEWFEYGGSPGCFRVDIATTETIREADIPVVAKAIDTNKNARSWLDVVNFRRETEGTAFFGQVLSQESAYEIIPQPIQNAQTTATIYIGAGLTMVKSADVAPKLASDSTVNVPIGMTSIPYVCKTNEI